MAKTELTKKIEKALWKENDKMGVFGCFEVSIGWGGSEIVDFLTYKTNGEFRCYEIKVSKADFNSKAKLSFHGDFNYFVMPTDLYQELKLDEQKKMEKFSRVNSQNAFKETLNNWGIGLITVSESGYLTTQVKPKRKYPDLSMKMTLLQSMLRSSNREVSKFYKLRGYWE